MANLIIKSSADNLVLQGSDASPAITVGATGTTTFAENMTLSGTANNLGTVASGNLNNNVILPRVKEMTHFKAAATSSTATETDNINISHSEYLSVTPDSTADIIEFSYHFSYYWSVGYLGFGIAKDTSSSGSYTSILWRTGQHTIGLNGDTDYGAAGGTISATASTFGMAADTTYYCRMIGQTHHHGSSNNVNWGTTATNSEKEGVYLTMKRWSIA